MRGMKSAIRRLSLSQAQDTERTPLLNGRTKQRDNLAGSALSPAHQHSETFDEDEEGGRQGEVDIDRSAVFCLLAQHTSSIFGASVVNYAAYIFLAECFYDTLAPASVMGMCTCASPMLFASWIGGLVDRTERLRFVRITMVVQKWVQIIIYGCFAILLGPFRLVARDALHHLGTTSESLQIWSLLFLLLVFVCIVKITDVGLGVATEKDWVLTISQGDPVLLTRLNTYMRMIATFSRIFPPIVVAAFVVAFGHQGSAIAMMVTTVASLLVEFWWLRVVFDRFPILRQDDLDRQAARTEAIKIQRSGSSKRDQSTLSARLAKLRGDLGEQLEVWRTFSSIPVFYTSLAAAGLWLSTLSLDGTGVSYFKLMHDWDEVVLAKIRVASLLTSLLGSFIVPHVEPRLGTSASAFLFLLLGLACLLVSLVGFFLEPSGHPSTGGIASYATTLMIVPIIWSRVGFVAFDLCQLKQLQLGLADRLDRNRLTALQSALLNLFAFARYGLLFIVSDPALFKWTAVVTVAAAVWSVGCYLIYMAKVRRVSRETLEEESRLL